MKTLQLRNNPAYNEGNLLGHQVTNGVFGAVPLTFTRNSNGYILDTNGDKLRGANVPRIKSDGSVLLEPARTNLLRYSEQFDNAAWMKLNATITPNAAIAPDGTMTADNAIWTNVNDLHLIYQSTSYSVTTYAQSYFVKPNGLNFVQIYAAGVAFIGSGAPYCNFDLINATLSNNGFEDASITTLENGWFRISVREPALVANNGVIALSGATSLSDGFRPSFTGDGTSGVYIWGAQLEAGAYPSSYIPTTSSTVTRVAESVSKTGIANLIGQSEGTIFFEGSFLNGSDNSRISLSDGTTNNRVTLGVNTSNQYILSSVESGITQVNSSAGSYINNSNVKIALKYKENYFALWVNGNELLIDASGLTYTGTTLSKISFDVGNGGVPFYGSVKQLALYTTALTDDELYNLTK